MKIYFEIMKLFYYEIFNLQLPPEISEKILYKNVLHNERVLRIMHK